MARNEREKLIEEFCNFEDLDLSVYKARKIADWVEADRKRIVGPLVNLNSNLPPAARIAVNEVLKNSGIDL